MMGSSDAALAYFSNSVVEEAQIAVAMARVHTKAKA